MKIEVNFSPDLDPDFCGELLMWHINPDNRWGYMTDTTTKDWYEQEKSTASLEVLTLLQGWFAKVEGNRTVRMLYNNTLGVKVYLHWDGDGTIVFELPDGNILINNDMKKSYGWEWNPDWIYDLPENYYEKG